MKKYMVLLYASIIVTSCSSNENKDKEILDRDDEVLAEVPEGNWKVNREYDEDGNLIRYDSIYSWSSGIDLGKLAEYDRDSTLNSLQSRFYRNFSQFDFEREGFGDFFNEDSLFTKRFFNDDFFNNDFGRDFMYMDDMYDRMNSMQKQFLERYKSLIEPER